MNKSGVGCCVECGRYYFVTHRDDVCLVCGSSEFKFRDPIKSYHEAERTLDQYIRNAANSVGFTALEGTHRYVSVNFMSDTSKVSLVVVDKIANHAQPVNKVIMSINGNPHVVYVDEILAFFERYSICQR